MFAVAIVSGIAIAVIVLFVFIAVVVGARQAHPTDLALQRPTRTAAVARHVLGLSVRRDEPQQGALDADWERTIR
jgi:hypothetical protein